MAPLARLALGLRPPLGTALRSRTRPPAVADRGGVFGGGGEWIHRRRCDPARAAGSPGCGVVAVAPRPRRFCSASSSPVPRDGGGRASPPRSERGRRRLRIGLASLPDAAAPSVPSPDGSPSPFPSEEGRDDAAGGAETDPLGAIALASLRGGVSGFDCPAPPSIDRNRSLPSGAAGRTCWDANRAGEVQVSSALDRAREALREEGDGGEAVQAINGEEGAVTLTCRLGYRAAVVLSDEEARDAKDATDDNDCNEREGVFEGDARLGLLFTGKPARDDEDSSSSQPAVALVHNLSKEYVLHSLRSSPLVRTYKLGEESGHKKNVRIISLAHNPETQVAAYLLSNHQDANGDSTSLLQRARDYMRRSLTSAFIGYEIGVQEGLIDGYGVDSNGLSLPESHDMHLGWRDLLECAADACLEVHGEEGSVGKSSLRAIRLPANVLETRGLVVAREIRAYLNDSPEEGLPSFADGRNDAHMQQRQRLRKLRDVLPESLDVCATRPLTAYPYGGTGRGPNTPAGLAVGSGAPPAFQKGADDPVDGGDIDATHPIRLLDYRVEAGHGPDASLMWSNHHYNRFGSRPAAYQPVLNAALSHFDADAILEASHERELTVEERETLDGCRLLRDMLHDLDAGLDTVRSFAAYEEYLMNRAVPLIHGSFEELDEGSAGMLQLFFRAHGMAARMAVARWTRELLLAGRKGVDSSDESQEGGLVGKKDQDKERAVADVWKNLGFGEFAGGYDVPDDVTLQEFALAQLLKGEAIQSLVLGCSRPEHVLEAMQAADSSASD